VQQTNRTAGSLIDGENLQEWRKQHLRNEGVAWPLVELTVVKMIGGWWGDVETEFADDKIVFGGPKTVLMCQVVPTRWRLHRVVQQPNRTAVSLIDGENLQDWRKQHFEERGRRMAWPLVELTVVKMIGGWWGDAETEFSDEEIIFGGPKTVLMCRVVPTSRRLHHVVHQTNRTAWSPIADRRSTVRIYRSDG
jgi:hypothetical protein